MKHSVAAKRKMQTAALWGCRFALMPAAPLFQKVLRSFPSVFAFASPLTGRQMKTRQIRQQDS